MQKEVNSYGGRLQMRILETFGSCGLPSCGVTDAAKIGQGVDGACAIGARSDVIIYPGTPQWKMPLRIQKELVPARISKSPRNMEKWLEVNPK